MRRWRALDRLCLRHPVISAMASWLAFWLICWALFARPPYWFLLGFVAIAGGNMARASQEL